MNKLRIFDLRKECLWILFAYATLAGALMCQVNEPSDESGSGNGENQASFITCPGPRDPANHTACCYGDEDGQPGNVGVPKCCLPLPPPRGLFYIDDQLAMIIALSVTTVCVICTIIIIVCCFWSRCPLFTACRIRYHQDDIIAYASKDEETAGLNDMPPEETKGVNVYSPNAVKVTMKDDV
ncbi:hypothetical protein O3P69_007422 [Scylla paramamosain]|uniref:Uncharacterized protein n=2 Tax=Scylla paramamosain TaxID=85552 RepID=A0AAW0V5R2_SCYPA